MADSIIGALRVVLGLDTAAFSSGAKEAQSTLDGLAKSFKTAFAGLALGTAAFQFTKAIQGAIDSADQLGKAAQKFGVPVEQLSALKYAAELADVSFESLGKGLGKLSKAMIDGISNPAGEAAKSFKALGLSLKDNDGNVKTSGDLFLDIADKFSKMEDGAAKTALAIRLFGRAGADLIPLLNQGRTGIKAYTDEAARLGIVISQETAAKAEQFNDTLKKIEATSRAAYLQIAAGLLDGLQKLADQFVNAQQKGGFLGTVIQALATFLNDLNNGINDSIAQFNTFKAVTADIGTTATSTSNEFGNLYLNLDNLNAPTKTLNAAAQTLSETYRQQVEILNANKAAHMTFETGLKTEKKATDDLNLSALAQKNAIDKFIEGQQKSIASTQAQAATLGTAVGTFEAMRITMEADSIAKTENITLTDAQRVALKNLSDQAGAAAIALAGAKLTQDFLSPWDLYAQKIRDVNIELAAHAISAQTAARASADAWSKAVSVFGTAAATTAGQFSDMFKAIGGQNKQMFAIAKAFAISQAIINTYVGVTKAYAEGGVLGLITGAGVLAAGLAAVAKIIAEKPPTAALGGSFMVPGGSMSIDTKLIPMALAPGERVDVTPANKVGAGGVLIINPIKPKDFFTGDTVREMVLSIDQWMRNGGSGVRFAQR